MYKWTSINWSNFCKLNIWGNIASVKNCQIARPDSLWKFGALKGECLWNYLVCWARKFNHISVVENALLIQNWLSYKLKYPRLNTRLSASYARVLCKHDAQWQNLTYFVTAVMTNTAHLALCYWGKKLYKQRFVSIYREVRVNIVLFTKSGD